MNAGKFLRTFFENEERNKPIYLINEERLIMKLKQFFLLCIIFFSSAAYATNDKTLHFGVSSIAGYLAETVIHSSSVVENSSTKRVVYGTLLGTVPGLVKEVLDSNEANNNFSGGDMVANVVGAFTGSFIANNINNRLNVSVTKNKDDYYIALMYRD